MKKWLRNDGIESTSFLVHYVMYVGCFLGWLGKQKGVLDFDIHLFLYLDLAIYLF